jgi:hypothetical protein
MLTRALLGLGLMTMVACGGGDDDGGGGGVTCAQAAAAIGDCGGELTEADFLESCDLFRYPDACLSAVAAAECAEHDEDMPSYSDTCFPSCNASDPAVCNDDDSITLCNEGAELTVYCEALCQQQEVPSAYTGTCAAEYMDMPSSTGAPVCWCE